MREATLDRFNHSELVTQGWLTIWTGERFAIIERPWLNNAVGVSCIPIGEYECVPSRYNRGGYDAVELMNVKGRSHIKIHIANYPWNVKGCLGVNVDFSCLKGVPCGVNSRKGFRRFMEAVEGEPFLLTISNKEAGIINPTRRK